MCRVLAYLGSPVVVDDLLYQPDSSLVQQTVQPRMLNLLNLAGFGMAAWDEQSHLPDIPFEYGTTQVPVFDSNLKALATKTRANCLLAHVRGVAYSHTVQVSRQNLHPFRYPDAKVALAHNGDLASFAQMKIDLMEHVRPEIVRCVHGTTDSEWIYALFLSQLDDPSARPESSAEILRALEKTLRIRRQSSTNRGCKMRKADGRRSLRNISKRRWLKKRPCTGFGFLHWRSVCTDPTNPFLPPSHRGQRARPQSGRPLAFERRSRPPPLRSDTFHRSIPLA